MWQTMGSPAQIIEWTPFDWAPGYYLLLGAWRGLVGIDPVILRFLSVLFSLLTIAVIYRVALRLTQRHSGGILAFMIYAIMGFTVYQGVILRGYSMLSFLGCLAFWLMLRYFARPTWRRGILLGAVLGAMLYTHYSAVFAFAAYGLYTLMTSPRRILRWLLPVAVLAILNIPQLPKQSQYLFTQSNFGAKPLPIEVWENLRMLFVDFSGDAWWVILLALLLAAVFYLHRRQVSRPMIALGLWVLMPLFLYISPAAAQIFSDPVTGTYLPRYFWWLSLPLVLWIAWGLSRAPRFVMRGIGALLVAGVLLPIPTRYQENVPPFMSVFSQLAPEVRAGDVFLIDPNFPERFSPYQWQYFTQVYFPSGINFVDEPGLHRRIWYISVNGGQDVATLEALNTDYVPGKFIGPWSFLVQLYQSPPDREGILFENGMRFHGADISGAEEPATTVYRAGETLDVRLWWSVDAPPARDYSIGLYLFDSTNALRTENNSAPLIDALPSETSRWETRRYYLDEREIVLPSQVQTQMFTLDMAVYQWWDGQRIEGDGVNADQLLHLSQFEINTWWLP